MYDAPALFQSDNTIRPSRRLKIVLFGATGQVGRRIAKEALDRGDEVVGVVRDPAHAAEAPDPRLRLVEGDATDAESVSRVARGADVVVSAISPRPDSHGLAASSLASAAHALITGTREAGVKRLIVVGGSSTLKVAAGVRLIDTDAIPEPFRAEAQEQADALDAYRKGGGDVDWAVVRPAAVFKPGVRTGTYRTTRDELPVDDDGQSQISFEDFAMALVDELEQPKHHHEAFTVSADPGRDSADPDEDHSSPPERT